MLSRMELRTTDSILYVYILSRRVFVLRMIPVCFYFACLRFQVTILCEKISRESMRNIADALRTNDRVTKLLLGGRELGADDAEALGWMLEASPSLQQLT